MNKFCLNLPVIDGGDAIIVGNTRRAFALVKNIAKTFKNPNLMCQVWD